MVSSGAMDMQALLITELSHCHELARQLDGQLEKQQMPPMLSITAKRVLESLEKSMSLVNHHKPDDTTSSGENPMIIRGAGVMEIKDRERRKRRLIPKFTKQVQISSGPGMEVVALDDGYSWKKYGQKKILYATYPRAYYRCTHLLTQGCPAKKKVQRSEKNSCHFEVTYEVTYEGEHTCIRRVGDNNKSLVRNKFETELRVKSEGEQEPPEGWSFSFPSTPIQNNTGNRIFSADNPNFVTGSSSNNNNNNINNNFSLSDSNYFQTTSFDRFGGVSFPFLESDFGEIVSADTSTTNPMELDQNLEFNDDFFA